MNNEVFKALYDCFYTPPQFHVQQQEVEECRKVLKEVLEKPERSLVLQIIDAKDYIIDNISIDSFISGFELSWKLSTELNNYENERLVSCETEESGARFVPGFGWLESQGEGTVTYAEDIYENGNKVGIMD